MLSPRLQLRADWRQAAVVNVPAMAEEVIDMLDRALDYLERQNQLTEATLTTVIELVTGSLPVPPDDTEILRHQLMRGVRDYAAVALLSDESDMDSTSTAFASEEALSSALLGLAHGDVMPDAPTEGVALDGRGDGLGPDREQFDHDALARTLGISNARRRLLRGARVGLIVAALAGGVYYLVAVRPSASAPATTSPPAVTATAKPLLTYSGTLAGKSTVCNGTPSASFNECDLRLDLNGSSGRLRVTVSWDTGDSLTTSVLDSTGAVVATQTNGGGHTDLVTPAIQAGEYVLLWTATPTTPLTFSVTVNGS
jgi:hypothetical protein